MKRKARHRQEREHPAVERNHLRSENRELKRRVARLQKQVSRLSQEEPSAQAEPTSAVDDDASAKALRCPKCGSSRIGTYSIPALGKVLVGCKDCKKYRAKL